MKTFDIETALSANEIEQNLKQLLSDNNSLLSSIKKSLLGDLSRRLQFEGYITDGNIYFVSYGSGYKKTVEIKGRISDLGNTRKVYYTVNMVKTIDWILYMPIVIIGLCFFVSSINKIPAYFSFPVCFIIILLIINAFINFDRKTTFRIGQQIFKVMITGKA